MPGSGSPAFAAEQAFPVGVTLNGVSTADVNGDGKPDIIATDINDGVLLVLLNTTAPGAATVSLAPPQVLDVGNLPLSVAVADVNGDGRPDLVSPSFIDTNVSVLLSTQYGVSVTPASVTGEIRYEVPLLQGAPTAIDFGEQPVGGAGSSQTLTLTNIGNADLAIGVTLGGAAAGDYAVTDGCPASLPPTAGSNSCTITISFTPSAAGARNAVLTMTTNAPDSPHSVALAGTGVVVAPPAPGNVAPVAADANLSTYEDQPLSGTLPASDANGDTLTFSITGQPANGAVTLDSATGEFTYTPDAGFTGSDEFAFAANDGALDSNTATVAVTVNAAPSSGGNTPPAGGGGDSGGSGGGAFELLMLAMLAGAAAGHQGRNADGVCTLNTRSPNKR